MSAKLRRAFLDSLDQNSAARLQDISTFWLRDEQVAPEGGHRIWLFLGGRGAGKTLAGGAWLASGIHAKRVRRAGLIGATYDDTRAIMIEGESGLLKVSPSATFEPSNRRIKWPNGAVATVLSADEPDSLRGHQFDALWLDGDRAPRKSSH